LEQELWLMVGHDYGLGLFWVQVLVLVMFLG
jgi:hypothetical protein